jgi:hypothetical protein
MERLDRHHCVGKLTRDCFARYPIWAWDESNEYHCPVLVFEPLPDDLGTLFVKATFSSSDGQEYGGYLVGGENPYAVGIFVGETSCLFNANAPDLIPLVISDMEAILRKRVVNLFPLRYRSEVRSKDGGLLAGVFNPKGM